MTKRAFLLLPLALAACTTEREPPPQPAPRPQARPVPAPPVPPPAPAPAPTGWADLPLTPGTWTYDNSGGVTSALFVTAVGQPASFILRCDPSGRLIRLMRSVPEDYAGATMTVRTSFGARSMPFKNYGGPGEYIGAELAPSDPFLDNMAFSRGRFSVEVAGLPMLVMPAWAEPARVIEDCRR